MPWQRQVIAVGTEYDPDTGRGYWSEVFVTTPRQSGKTTLILLLLLERCLRDDPQLCIWTGQDGKSIRKKWLRELVPMLERSKLAPLVANVRRSNGDEAIEWETGSVIELLPTTEDAGHGMTIDLAVMDEIWSDTDDRRDQAIGPAMITRPDAQLLTCSTAGTAKSTVYNRRVRAGRNAVAEDIDRGLAYFEWSAPDDWDPDVDDTYWEFHPALGHTITIDRIVEERRKLAERPDEFARAYGNRPNTESGDVIPTAVWEQVVSATAKADPGTVTLGIDVSPQRDAAAIAVCDRNGVCELAAYDSGVGWVLKAAKKAISELNCAVVFDARGPAGSLQGINELEGAKPLKSGQVLDACQQFFDAVADRTVKVRQDDALDRAIKGLERKMVGDGYCWSRRASTYDVTPLYAVTLAWSTAVSSVDEYQGPLVAVR